MDSKKDVFAKGSWEVRNAICDEVATVRFELEALTSIMGLMINEFEIDARELNETQVAYIQKNWNKFSSMFHHVLNSLADSTEKLEKIEQMEEDEAKWE